MNQELYARRKSIFDLQPEAREAKPVADKTLGDCTGFICQKITGTNSIGLQELVDHRVSVFGHRCYVTGGGGSRRTHFTLYMFDRVTNTWYNEPMPYLKHINRAGHFSWTADDRFYVFGGLVGNQPELDIWCFDVPLEEGRFFPVQGVKPRCSLGVSGAYFDTRKEVFLFGGKRGITEEPSDELIAFKMANHEFYHPVTKGQTPPARHSHACCNNRDSLYVFGGKMEDSSRNDLYVLRMHKQTLTWSEAIVDPGYHFSPRSRTHFSMVYVEGRLLIYGGVLGPRRRGTRFCVYNVRQNEFFDVLPAATAPRHYKVTGPFHAASKAKQAVALVNDTTLLIFGGVDGVLHQPFEIHPQPDVRRTSISSRAQVPRRRLQVRLHPNDDEDDEEYNEDSDDSDDSDDDA